MKVDVKDVTTVVHRLPGSADIDIKTKIDFKQPHVSSHLRDIVSTAERQGWEGLVTQPQQ